MQAKKELERVGSAVALTPLLRAAAGPLLYMGLWWLMRRISLLNLAAEMSGTLRMGMGAWYGVLSGVVRLQIPMEVAVVAYHACWGRSAPPLIF